MPEFKDLFISYGRRESLNFVARLHQQLKLAGYDAWFDKINIPVSEDYIKHIHHGIESAHNFIYVMAPHSLCSPYCLMELEYARLLGKRVIPINHHVVEQTDKGALSEEVKQDLNDFYHTYGIKNPQLETYQQLLEHSLYKVVDKTNWLQGKEVLSDQDCEQLGDWAQSYENKWHQHDIVDALKQINLPQFGQAIDSLQDVVASIKKVLERHKSYVYQHTLLLYETLEWQRHQYISHHLLVGKERQKANDFLLTSFSGDEQAPCTPSALMCEFVCESRKHSENKMTDCFICYASEDKARCDEILQKLSRHTITTWRHDRDIDKGEEYQQLIHAGIEAADSLIFLISPDSVASNPCYEELNYAQTLHKRIIPLLVTPTPSNALPPFIRELQYIDVSHPETGEYISDIIPLLQQDRDYHKRHKILLTQALRWQASVNKLPFLLRGHNLENAKTWLRLHAHRIQHTPTALQKEFITASEAAKGQLSTEVFLSYSRKDGDFARRLNLALQEAGKTVWFDQESIATGIDFETELNKGIDGADNFVFIVSPDSVNSEYCDNEVRYAAAQRKRILTVLVRETDVAQIPEELINIQWLDFVEGSFEEQFSELIQAIELDRDHAHQHTLFQQRAMEWTTNQKNKDYLLNASACKKAEKWLKEAEGKNPVITEIQQQHIDESREEIRRKQQKEKRRQHLILVGLFFALVLAGFSWLQMEKAKKQHIIAEKQKTVAIQQRSEALNARSLYLASIAKQQVINNKPSTAMRLALDGLPNHSETVSFFDLENEKASYIIQPLYDAVSKHSQGILEHDDYVTKVIFTPDNNKLISQAYNYVYIWDKYRSKLLQTLVHQDAVNDIALSPDGQLLVTSSSDKTAQIWDMNTGKMLHTLQHEDVVYDIAFSPDGKQLSTLSKHSAYLWEVSTGQMLDQFPHEETDSLWHITFSPNGELLSTASAEGIVHLWKIKTREKLHTFLHNDTVYHTAFSPDGKLLGTASREDKAYLWDIETGTVLHTLEHSNAVFYIAFSPDNKLLSTASFDTTACLWDIDTGKKLKTFQHEGKVWHTSFSAGGELVNTSSGYMSNDKGAAHVWETDTGKLLRKFDHDAPVFYSAFSPNDWQLSTASFDNTARVWEIATEGLLHTFRHPDIIHHITFSPDGKLLSTASEDQTVRLWELTPNKIPRVIEHQGTVYQTAFSSDSQLLVTASEDNTASLWNLETGKIVQVFQHDNQIRYAELSPNNRLLSTASADKTARLWDVKTGKHLYTLQHQDVVWLSKFSANGELLVSTSDDGAARLWNTNTGKILYTLQHESPVYDAIFSPDGKLLATASADKTARLWDIKTGQLLHTLQHDFIVKNVIFSPNGQLLSTVSGNSIPDGIAHLWDVNTGKALHIFKDMGMIWHTAFSPNGKLLSIASGNIKEGTVDLWHIESAKFLYKMKHDQLVRYATFSPDGQSIAAASEDGIARLWLVFYSLDELANYAKNLFKGHPLQHRLSCSKRKAFLLETLDRCKQEKGEE